MRTAVRNYPSARSKAIAFVVFIMAGSTTAPANASSSLQSQSRLRTKSRFATTRSSEYLGVIFAYLGEGEPPELPRYPEFENSDALLETKDDSYKRACNYFNNLENSLDTTHVGFVHRVHRGAFDGIKDSPTLTAEESAWGVTFRVTRPSGAKRVTQFGMPNIFHMHTSIPSDPEIGWKESLIWWVPIDDENHRQFRVNLVPVSGQAAEAYLARQEKLRANMNIPHGKFAEEILAGKFAPR